MPEPHVRQEASAVFYYAQTEELLMNRHHLLLVLQRTLGASGRAPRWEWWAATGSTCLALLLSLVAADFHDFLSIRAAVWQAVALILFAGTAIVTLVLLVWWAFAFFTRRPQTAEDICEQLIKEMVREERGQSRQAPRLTA